MSCPRATFCVPASLLYLPSAAAQRSLLALRGVYVTLPKQRAIAPAGIGAISGPGTQLHAAAIGAAAMGGAADGRGRERPDVRGESAAVHAPPPGAAAGCRWRPTAPKVRISIKSFLIKADNTRGQRYCMSVELVLQYTHLPQDPPRVADGPPPPPKCEFSDTCGSSEEPCAALQTLLHAAHALGIAWPCHRQCRLKSATRQQH